MNLLQRLKQIFDSRKKNNNKPKTKGMTIAIDFDGTIVENKYPRIGQLLPYAPESIRKLYQDGHCIIIWTSRDGRQLLDAVNFLLQNNIPFHRVNDNIPENTRQFGSNSRKVFADIYIDDRNLFGFSGWQIALEKIRAMAKENIPIEKTDTSAPSEQLHIESNYNQKPYILQPNPNSVLPPMWSDESLKAMYEISSTSERFKKSLKDADTNFIHK